MSAFQTNGASKLILKVFNLKFENGEVISSHSTLALWSLIHAGIKIIPRE